MDRYFFYRSPIIFPNGAPGEEEILLSSTKFLVAWFDFCDVRFSFMILLLGISFLITWGAEIFATISGENSVKHLGITRWCIVFAPRWQRCLLDFSTEAILLFLLIASLKNIEFS